MNPEFVQKAWRTKCEKGNFGASKPENRLYELLCDVFGKEDVIRQYIDEVRYPFYCDFYIQSLNLFIELNAHWVHGGHWFDKDNLEDIVQLHDWIERFRIDGSSFYFAAIERWTERDLLKRQFALDNHLNYIVFWNNDLSDAQEFLSKYRVIRSEAAE